MGRVEEMIEYSQGCQDQEDGEVDLDDHVQVFLREGCCKLADEDQHDGGQSCC